MTDPDTPVRRIRRTPEDARRLILDAAEASMVATGGPAGIRLQDVAAAAGVSHPTILHHFGSREGLVQALNRRTLEDLKTVLIANIESNAAGDNAVASAFAAYRDGLAQRMLWMLQAPAGPGPAGLPMFEEIVQALHAVRVSIAAPGVAVDPFDSRAIVHLTTIAAFGDAILGPRLRQAAGPDEEAASRQRFEGWFKIMINGFVAAKARPDDAP
jgi:AcrR family transcriptional regulator